MSKKHKKVCTALNSLSNFFILFQLSTSVFQILLFLVGFLINTASSTVVLKIWAITVAFKIISLFSKRKEKAG